MWLALSPLKKVITRATSRERASRLSGVFCMILSRPASSLFSSSAAVWSVGPGHTQFTRTPVPPSSAARCLVKPTSAYFEHV
jgi:hypothetical protein